MSSTNFEKVELAGCLTEAENVFKLLTPPNPLPKITDLKEAPVPTVGTTLDPSTNNPQDDAIFKARNPNQFDYDVTDNESNTTVSQALSQAFQGFSDAKKDFDRKMEELIKYVETAHQLETAILGQLQSIGIIDENGNFVDLSPENTAVYEAIKAKISNLQIKQLLETLEGSKKLEAATIAPILDNVLKAFGGDNAEASKVLNKIEAEYKKLDKDYLKPLSSVFSLFESINQTGRLDLTNQQVVNNLVSTLGAVDRALGRIGIGYGKKPLVSFAKGLSAGYAKVTEIENTVNEVTQAIGDIAQAANNIVTGFCGALSIPWFAFKAASYAIEAVKIKIGLVFNGKLDFSAALKALPNILLAPTLPKIPQFKDLSKYPGVQAKAWDILSFQSEFPYIGLKCLSKNLPDAVNSTAKLASGLKDVKSFSDALSGMGIPATMAKAVRLMPAYAATQVALNAASQTKSASLLAMNRPPIVPGTMGMNSLATGIAAPPAIDKGKEDTKQGISGLSSEAMAPRNEAGVLLNSGATSQQGSVTITAPTMQQDTQNAVINAKDLTTFTKVPVELIDALSKLSPKMADVLKDGYSEFGEFDPAKIDPEKVKRQLALLKELLANAGINFSTANLGRSEDLKEISAALDAYYKCLEGNAYNKRVNDRNNRDLSKPQPDLNGVGSPPNSTKELDDLGNSLLNPGPSALPHSVGSIANRNNGYNPVRPNSPVTPVESIVANPVTTTLPPNFHETPHRKLIEKFLDPETTFAPPKENPAAPSVPPGKSIDDLTRPDSQFNLEDLPLLLIAKNSTELQEILDLKNIDRLAAQINDIPLEREANESLLTKTIQQGYGDKSPYTWLAKAVKVLKGNSIVYELEEFLRVRNTGRLEELLIFLDTLAEVDYEVPLARGLTPEEKKAAERSYAYVKANRKKFSELFFRLRSRAETLGGGLAYEYFVAVAILIILKRASNQASSVEAGPQIAESGKAIKNLMSLLTFKESIELVAEALISFGEE